MRPKTCPSSAETRLPAPWFRERAGPLRRSWPRAPVGRQVLGELPAEQAGQCTRAFTLPGIVPRTSPIWRFCAVIGRDDLTRAREFATAAARRDRRGEIAAIIQQGTGARAKAEVVHTLVAAGVPAAPVNNVAEMVVDPQVRAREMFVELDHSVYGPLTTTGTPLKLSETPGRVRWLAPMPGEHNEEVFMGVLGHSPEELERWRAEGVI